jgi:hypothetical protein
MSVTKDYEAMNNPELLKYFEDNCIAISPSLHNELVVIRGVTYDSKAEAAHDRAVKQLRDRDSRKYSRKSLMISIISLLTAAVALVVSLLARHK